jgi:hypothetical protein
MLTVIRFDDVITFKLNEETYMYYNTNRRCITVLAAKPAYNAQHTFPSGLYLFYDFHKNLAITSKTFLTYDKLCTGVYTVLAFHKIRPPMDVVINVT